MAAAKKKPKAKAKAAPKRERRPAEPKHEPTDQTRAIVERASLTGKLTHDDIGALIGISDVTLRKYYAAELRSGRDKTTVAVLNSFVKNCVGDAKTPGDVNAQKFYLERFAGMGATVGLKPEMPAGVQPGTGVKFTLEFVDPVTPDGDGGKAPSR